MSGGFSLGSLRDFACTECIGDLFSRGQQRQKPLMRDNKKSPRSTECVSKLNNKANVHVKVIRICLLIGI